MIGPLDRTKGGLQQNDEFIIGIIILDLNGLDVVVGHFGIGEMGWKRRLL